MNQGAVRYKGVAGPVPEGLDSGNSLRIVGIPGEVVDGFALEVGCGGQGD